MTEELDRVEQPSPPAAAPTGRLGCAETYHAVVHDQGGAIAVARLDGVTKLSWSRVLDDYSSARVTVTKSEATADCCGQLGQLRAFAHELTIYRDHGLVWQGPIYQIDETALTVTIYARDMLFWLDRREIAPSDWWLNGKSVSPVEFSPGQLWPGSPAYEEPYYYQWTEPTNIGVIISRIMRDAFPSWDAARDPGLIDYARIDTHTAVAPRRVTLDRIYWGEQTVGQVIRGLIDVGADLFTMGRRTYFVPDDYRLAHGRSAPYRLTPDHFLDELTVRQSGLDMATRGIATGEPPVDPTTGNKITPPDTMGNGQPTPEGWQFPGQSAVHGSYREGYGTVTRIVNQRAATDQDQHLAQVARSVVDYGFPPPLDLIVPDGARLSSDAPVSVNQLVPGRPFLILMDRYCRSTHALTRLSELDVTWSAADTEDVSITVSSNGPPDQAREGSA